MKRNPNPGISSFFSSFWAGISPFVSWRARPDAPAAGLSFLSPPRPKELNPRLAALVGPFFFSQRLQPVPPRFRSRPAEAFFFPPPCTSGNSGEKGLGWAQAQQFARQPRPFFFFPFSNDGGGGGGTTGERRPRILSFPFPPRNRRTKHKR